MVCAPSVPPSCFTSWVPYRHLVDLASPDRAGFRGAALDVPVADDAMLCAPGSGVIALREVVVMAALVPFHYLGDLPGVRGRRAPRVADVRVTSSGCPPVVARLLFSWPRVGAGVPEGRGPSGPRLRGQGEQ